MKTGKCSPMLTMAQRQLLVMTSEIFQLERLREANQCAARSPVTAATLRADAAKLNAATDALRQAQEIEVPS